MRLQFDGIRFKNLLSTGEAWNVVPLNNDDITVIVGKNGCGKSTIIDAIVFGLFGKPFRKIRKAQLVNSINRKNCVVEIAFRRGNDRYVIKRGIKPNIFEIYKNKELIPEDASTASYQTMLERDIIGCSYKTFCQINIIGKSGYTPYMQLEPKDRRVVVDELLESGIYTTMRDIAAAQLKTQKQELESVNKDIAVLKERILGQERLINRQSTDKAEQIAAKKQIISNAETRLAEYQTELEEAQKRADQALADIDKLGVEPNAVVDAFYELKSNISTLERQIEDAQRKMRRVISSDHCTACLQKIDHTHKSSIEAECQGEINLAEAEKAKLEKRLSKINEIKETLEDLQETKSIVDRQVTSWKMKVSSQIDTISNHEVELEDLISRKDERSAGDLEELENLNDELSKVVETYDILSSEIEVTKKAMEYLGDDGIKAELINKFIPKINQLINEYLDRMNLFVQFELDGEFNETIRSRYRDDYSYDSFSEGEKLRIDMAIMLTWRQIALQRNSSPTNLLVMDEIFDGSMDGSGIYDVIQVLKSMPDTKNSYVISHRSEVSDELADNVITAEKIGNYTTYT